MQNLNRCCLFFLYVTGSLLGLSAWLYATGGETGPVRRVTEQAAQRESHWAYVAPRRAAPLRGEDRSKGDGEMRFLQNDIDRFVLAKLRALNLFPSAEADPRTLVRRLSFDLTGLPPSWDDVDAFVNDASNDAYERLVDRMLASAHFGERMAMHWLDLVRYGDTNGYHADVHRHVFPYRDYVIDAFNSNKRFDQFTIEQLAGDLLPGATLEQRVASAYNRMNMITTEGGAQEKEYLAKYAADRVRDASSVWLASTLGCAECHDHKYDPFTTRDFYRFAAFFADVKQVGVYPNKVDLDPQLKVPTPSQAAELARLDERIAPFQRILDTQMPELDAAQAEWEQSLADAGIDWTVLRPATMTAQNGTTLTLDDDGSIRAAGERPDSDTYTLVIETELKGLTALRIEVLPDDSLPNKGPGRADNGNFVLSRLALDVLASGGDQACSVTLQNASASFEQKAGNLGVAGAIDPAKKKAKSGWAVGDQVGRAHHAVFETQADLGDGTAKTLRLTLEQTHGLVHTIGRFRLAATATPRPVTASSTKIRGVPDSIADSLLIEPDSRSEEDKKALSKHFRGIAPQLETVRKDHADLKRARDDLDKMIPITLVTVSVEPQAMRILPRGNWMDESGEIVQPGVPHFLPQSFAARAGTATGSCEGITEGTASGAEPEGVAGRTPCSAGGERSAEHVEAATAPSRLTRLDLARWLVSRDNPLTARVFVNHLWKLLFGQGLVRTTDDFGVQGDPPTHPELLDWLAVEFIDSGWDVKHMIRLIVTSGTYRQSSQASAELRRIDPYNQWLARQGSFRLDAEMVRDNALAVSGLLTNKLGGRSVKPYQPDGYWDHCNTFQGKLIYDQDHGEDLYRRGLYSYWKRTFLHPAMLAFDAPSREECSAERPRSNTPLQALVLLNDPTYVEAARVFAERIVRDAGPAAEDRIRFAYRQALARAPRPDELTLLATTLQQHREQYEADAAAASALIKVGEWPVPDDIDAAQLAAWTSIARVILNLHETMTRY